MPDLSDRMEWQYAAEPDVMTWTVKAIDRNILIWVCLFGSVIVPFAIASFIFYMKDDGLMASGFLFAISILVFLFFKIGLEKTVFVYRATEERLEVCQWQDIPDLVFTFLKVFPFIVVGIILMALISNPALSFAALAGPALVGILLASVGGDSHYKAIYKRFRHDEVIWSEIRKALLDEKKGLLALSVDWENKVIDPAAVDLANKEHHIHLYPVYFRKDQERSVLALIRERVPDATVMVEGQYTYPFSG
ncbi:hypothetical protein [Halopseudomonas xiamenensis]|uniref:hypothetical protein n=1 Tax=Halopseudomonas xiamenensis TaxID=157792 RepID=UPI001629FE25|nr:hypothetical protein [Halopseudomonas xiamenensis]